MKTFTMNEMENIFEIGRAIQYAVDFEDGCVIEDSKSVDQVNSLTNDILLIKKDWKMEEKTLKKVEKETKSFLKDVIRPVLEDNQELLGVSVEISV